jgi:D-tagatose-1,6-bisphosphate aldolase subunit GatZ/KbaZ
MRAVRERIARHKAGERCGMFSVCSAHPLVIEATLRHARRFGLPFALIEATSNQVNQEGGYTGMGPAQFRALVEDIADRVSLPRNRIILGGDHLGPNPWQALPAETAMARAQVLIADYVGAGFRKIHLDCSMRCADDPPALSEETTARRAAQLCAVAEAAHGKAGGELPVYVIGTEVPSPGGAKEELDSVAVTAPAAARATIDMHRAAFDDSGLKNAWARVIAAVVQPGVEYDHRKVVAYAPEKARALSQAINGDQLVFEAHSTDYQASSALAALVRDHFAILKVGPALTFALREALWALDAIEHEWIRPSFASNFRAIVLARMKAQPRHWQNYYDANGASLDRDLQYSLSDRIRYYWPDPEIAHAQSIMFQNLAQHPPPPASIGLHLPLSYAALRDGLITLQPAELVMAHVWSVLDGYHAATSPPGETQHV